MRFRTEQHLRRQDDFRALRAEGFKVDCGSFTLWWRLRTPPVPDSPPRLGVVASIASVGIAVQRNRAKRRLRAIFRNHQGLVPRGCDILLVARAAVNRLDYGGVEQRFIAACSRIAPPTHA